MTQNITQQQRCITEDSTLCNDTDIQVFLYQYKTPHTHEF